MAGWNFRRRVKIAPGVTLNFSKSGVSTSVGPRGAKVTFGKNGTYLNTGIPGTGIYKRQKIGGGNSVRQPSNGGKSPGCMITLIVLLFIAAIVLYSDIDTTLATILFAAGILLTIILIFNHKGKKALENTEETKPKDKKGCLKFFVWTVLIFNVLILFVNTINTTKYDADKYTEVAQKQVEASAEQNSAQVVADSTISDATAERLAYALICVIIIICIIVLVKLYSKDNKQDTIEKARAIDSLKHQANDENDPLKKKILNDHIGYLIQKDIDNRLKPLVEKYGNLVAKKSKPQWIQQLQQYGEELNNAQEEATKLRYDVIGELTDDEKEKYAAFCDAYKTMRNSQKAWLIISEVENTQLKSFANTSVNRTSYKFIQGCYKELNIPYEVPQISGLNKRVCYFYPRFVIITKDDSFNVLPISAISLNHSIVLFQEEGTVPSDSELVRTTYKYVNKNGEPDKRYANNYSIPVMRYGNLNIKSLGVNYIVSNNLAVEQFCKSFEILKSVCEATMPSSINNIDLESLKALDPFFEDAARIVVINQQGSTSLIQRKFSIGYNRAGRIMDQLEEAGIVGPYKGVAIRDVLISDESKIDDIIINYAKKKSNNLKTNNITFISEQLFEDYCIVVKRVSEMAKWMKNDTEFKSILAKQHITFSGEALKDDEELINVLIEIDFLKCVLKLGKQLDLKHNDCFGLLLLYMALGNDMFITYDKIGTAIEKVSESIQNIYEMLKSAIEKNAEVEGGFMVSYILGEVDKKKQSSYLICLHRFSTIIAGIDNEITDEEQKGIDYVSEKLNSVDLSDNNKDSKFDAENEKTKENAKTKSKPRSHKAADELQKLIGLQSVKSEVETLTNFIKIQQSRAEKGLKATSVSYHCVFTGNPGTGKTTVARIVANIYKELGVLKKGHLVETDRSGLVAEYVGQTAVKTNKVIDSALDGVLFIDEAYSLVGGGQNDFGIEAISTLLKRMEDDRDRLVVILAGYSNEMQTFINANPGLQSRFNRYIEFPDYSADELAQIFEFNLTKNEYAITEEAKKTLNEYLNKVVATKDERFGNARFVRNLFEKTIERQANRLAQEKQLTAEMLTTIELADLAV